MKRAHLIAIVLLVSSLPCAFGIQDSSPTPTATPAPTPADSPKPPLKLRVSPGVAEGLVLRKVNPRYPPEARKNHIQGDVILQIEIDKRGNVARLKVAQGDPTLAEAAVDAVRQWKYKPYVLNGEPVELATTVKIQFHL